MIAMRARRTGRIGVALLVAWSFAGVARADEGGKAADAKKQGDALLAEGKTKEALDAYVIALTEDPGHTPALDAAAPLWFKAGEYDTAIRWLNAAVERKPTYSLGWYNLAFAHRKLKNYPAAITAYEKFRDLRPEEPDPYFGLGMTYKAMGDLERARAAFAAYVAKEKRVEKQKFVEQAKKELEALGGAGATAPPRPPEATPSDLPPQTATKRDVAVQARKQGDELRAAGDLKAAEKKYREAIAIDPDYAAAHNELGTLLFQQKKIDEAIVEFEAAVKSDVKDDLAWYNLAHARRKAGRHKEAVAAYRAYIELRPDNPDPFYGLGHSLKALGDLAGAQAAFKRYVTLEKRESEQKWVEKAKQEVAELDKAIGVPAEAGKPVEATATTPTPPVEAKPVEGKPVEGKPVEGKPVEGKPVEGKPVEGKPVEGKPVEGKPVEATAPTAPPAPPAPPADAPKPPDATETLPPPPVVAPPRAIDPSSADAVTARAYVVSADHKFADKDYAAAADLYRQAAAADPTSVDTRYRLGVAVAATGDLGAAIAAWESALLLDPTHERSRRNVELARRRLARADVKADAVIEDDAALLARAQKLVGDGRHGSALLVIGEYVRKDAARAKNVDVLLVRAEARLGTGDTDGARHDYQAILSLAPTDARAFKGLSAVYEAQGDAKRATYFREQAAARAAGAP